MSNIEALSKTQHKNVKINKNYSHLPAAQTHVVPILVTELLAAGAHYPLFLTKNAQTGDFVCIALLGFKESENLYIEQGDWQASHVPLTIARQPFHINQENKNIYIDTLSPWVAQEEGDAIFLENGDLTGYMENVIDNLSKIPAGAVETQSFINALAESSLIEPIELSATFNDNSSEKLDGLYTISREKLTNMQSEQLVSLHQSGVLEGAYIMLNSVEHVKTLISKKNKKIKG
jgi:hypothetical protein